MNTLLILILGTVFLAPPPSVAVVQQKGVTPAQPVVIVAPELPPCFAAIPSDFEARCPRTIREYFRSRGWMPSERAIAELEANKEEIIAVCTTATMPCDWGIDWYSTAPDLGRLKGWMSILDSDSRRLERFSRRMESAERIISMFDLARILAAIPLLDMQREASCFGCQSIQRTY